jgi:hypothetical protein
MQNLNRMYYVSSEDEGDFGNEHDAMECRPRVRIERHQNVIFGISKSFSPTSPRNLLILCAG